MLAGRHCVPRIFFTEDHKGHKTEVPTEGNEDNEGKRSKVAQKPVALALCLLR